MSQKKFNWGSGMFFGSFMLTGKSYTDERRRRLVECLCICGNTVFRLLNMVINCKINSCGCQSKENQLASVKTHGLTKHPLYRVWAAMKNRCYNLNSKYYKYYGALGVKVCDEWVNDFVIFYNWAINNGWENGLQLDKDKLAVNNQGKLYSPDFCCFITANENMKYRKCSRNYNYKGETKNLIDLCAELKLNYDLIYLRLSRGWDIDRALETSVQ